LTLAAAMDRGHVEGDFSDCDVVIDFSVAAATDALLNQLAETGAALVTGTTGRTADQENAIQARAVVAPVFSAANYSLGVAVLADLVDRAARALGPAFDVEVFELHHRRKIDAPSGTALHLARVAAEARGVPWPGGRQHREGHTGPRGEAEIGTAALRGGAVTGDHTVFFLGAAERVELIHRAADRDVFAHGALRAAAWVVGRAPGCYDMKALLASI
jgi:4-hydroxy-tetrahydrodipicolinate reductase